MNTLTAIALPSILLLFSLVCVVWLPCFLVLSTILLFDVLARHKDYKSLCKSLTQENLLTKFKRHRRSACQRYACKAAARQKGLTYKGTFKTMGYKWYHVFPDGTFSRDCPFLKLAFYKVLVFGTNSNKRST